MDLYLHSYQYYPYERDLALREIESLEATEVIFESPTTISLKGTVDPAATERLVYVNSYWQDKQPHKTLQARLEEQSTKRNRRQSTRYSVHGLHEYKGKFNPQIVRALLNILGIKKADRVYDPFCGSGTTLIECAHIGISALGTDINPFAVFLANAKLDALRIPVSRLTASLNKILKGYKENRNRALEQDERIKYLQAWFEPYVLNDIETLRRLINYRADQSTRNVFLAIASNMLRDYSLQDPGDLRIRRRKTPLPASPFIRSFEQAVSSAIAKIEHAQNILKDNISESVVAILTDIRKAEGLDLGTFDCAVTSPPYATALPYIDTQRLSLAWLGLVAPSEILKLEGSLIGSRELRGDSKQFFRRQLSANEFGLPATEAEYCQLLQNSLTESDGFRRQATPSLLYRYFADMAESFRNVRKKLRSGAPYALVVGSNHTVLGGNRFDIDTPRHLQNLAEANGFVCEESISMETYARYGYNASKAITKERLLVLRAQ